MYGCAADADKRFIVKKKKTSKLLMPVIMLVLTAALLIAYLALGKSDPAGDETDTGDTNSEVTIILQRDASTITELSYTLHGEKPLTFAYNSASSQWSYAPAPAYPLLTEHLDYMAAAISYIGVYRTLDTGDTGIYGFENPAVTIDVSYADGSRYSFAIGNQNSMTGYHYFKDLESGTVYTIDPALLPYFQVKLEDMFAYDSLNTDVEEAYITSLTWNVDGNTGTLENLSEKDRSTIYAAYQSLKPAMCADWSGTDDALASYGIGNNTVTIGYRRVVASADESGNEVTTRIAATYTIQFGTPAGDGRIPYVLPNSHVIYLEDFSLLEPAISLMS